MQLYIRGAWRTFNPKTERRHQTEPNSRDTGPIWNIIDGVEALPGNVAGGRSRGRCHSSRELVTTNIRPMKTFYTALAGRLPLLNEVDKCLIRLDDGQDIWIVRAKADSGKTTCQQPKSDISIEKNSAKALMMVYERCQQAGISPMQTWNRGNLMQFLDPDGNTVNVCLAAPEVVSIGVLVDQESSSANSASRTSGQVEGLSQASESHEEEPKVVPGRKESSSVFVKIESHD